MHSDSYLEIALCPAYSLAMLHIDHEGSRRDVAPICQADDEGVITTWRREMLLSHCAYLQLGGDCFPRDTHPFSGIP